MKFIKVSLLMFLVSATAEATPSISGGILLQNGGSTLIYKDLQRPPMGGCQAKPTGKCEKRRPKNDQPEE